MNGHGYISTSDNIRQILSRLVKSGELNRITQGVYCCPDHSSEFGERPPPLIEIAKTITQATGETISLHGAEAARMLGLTTQMPMQLILYTNGNTRKFIIGNRTITLKRVNPSKLTNTNTKPGLVIAALSYMGKENVNIEIIKKIQKQLSENEFDELLSYCQHMPIWMADYFFKFQEINNNGQ